MKHLITVALAFTLLFGFAGVPFAPTVTAAPVQQAPTGLTATVVASQLFIRTRASATAGVLSTVNWGDTLEVLGRNKAATWLKVRKVKDGTVGWISAFWVRLSKNVNRTTLPIVS